MLLLALWVGAGGAWGTLFADPDHTVKAAFLYNFATYVEWPTNAHPSAVSPLVIGVLGDDALVSELKRIASGKQVQNRRVEVVRVASSAGIRTCHILFLGESQRERTLEILASLDRQPTLTVGETDGFCERGGMINFCLENDRVRFEINPRTAERAGLKISSKLLRLARIVPPQPPSPRR